MNYVSLYDINLSFLNNLFGQQSLTALLQPSHLHPVPSLNRNFVEHELLLVLHHELG